MNIFVDNGKKISLSKKDFIDAGGEGQVYAKDGLAYKIYNSKKNVIDPIKIKELSVIKNEDIIRPKSVVLDSKNIPIGYSMRHIDNAFPLCKIFTKSFKDKNNILVNNVIDLIEDMKAKIYHIHDNDILIVDLNEMNFLIDKNFKKILFIDVDSYKTKSFSATAIMESIRDRHSSGFSEETDWFSFAIVSFEMMVGIHPYKGRHPAYKGNKHLDERMMKNVSVLNGDVSIPKICLPLDKIPSQYYDWYNSVFELGKRLPPPDGVAVKICTPDIIIVDNHAVNILTEKIQEYNSKIYSIDFLSGDLVSTSDDGIFVNNKNHEFKGTKVCLSKKKNKIIAARVEKDIIKAYNITDSKDIVCNLSSESIMSYNGFLYSKNKDGLYRIEFLEVGKNICASMKLVCNVLDNATKIFDGIVTQNLLGSHYISVFENEVHTQLKIPELSSYRVIDAKYDNGVAIIFAEKQSKYYEFIIKINNHGEYDISVREDVMLSSINFVSLDTGVCVRIDSEGDLELFCNRIGYDDKKVIKSGTLHNSVLYRDGSSALILENNIVYRLKLKK